MGDDDVILIGYGVTDNENDVTVYAGDGDDLVDIHGDWHSYLIYGGRGADTFNVDGGWVTDGSDDFMVSDKLYSLIGKQIKDIRQKLMNDPCPKNLQELLKTITPPKGIRRKIVREKSLKIHNKRET